MPEDIEARLSIFAAQLLVGIAYAEDGLSRSERECVKDIVFQISDLSYPEYQRVIEAADRGELTMEFLENRFEMVHEDLSSVSAMLKQALFTDVHSDVHSDSERRLLHLLKKPRRVVFEELSLALNKAIEGRMLCVGKSQNEYSSRVEDYFHDIADDLSERHPGYFLDDLELQRSVLLGMLLSRIVPDYMFEQPEELKHALKAAFSGQMPEMNEHVELIFESILETDHKRLDLIRLCRLFSLVAGREICESFLGVCFGVSDYMHDFHDTTLEIITFISANLRCSQLSFQKALEQVLDRWYDDMKGHNIIEYQAAS